MTTKITPVVLVERMLEILKTKENWCQHTMARSKNKPSVSVYSKYATSFCLLGAMKRAAGRNLIGACSMSVVEQEIASTLRENGNPYITDWNDELNRNFEDVKSLLRSVRKNLIEKQVDMQ